MPLRLDRIQVSCVVRGAWIFAGVAAGVLGAGIKEGCKELPLGQILGGVVGALAKQVDDIGAATGYAADALSRIRALQQVVDMLSDVLFPEDSAAFQAIVAALKNLMDAVEGWKQLSWSNKHFGISIGLTKGVQSKAAEYTSRFEECFGALDAARGDLTSAVSAESFAGEFLLLAAQTS
jgi:hypothetical protein